MRSRFALPLAGSLAVSLFLAAAPLPAQAQDTASERERERRVEETIARLRNPSPVFVGDAERIRTLVQELLNARSPRADAVLRELLLDTGAHANIVEQIALATLTDPEHRFLPDLVERLRLDAEGDLDRALARHWPRADAATIRTLSGIARDGSRSAGVRKTAVRLLGRTGDGAALHALVALWNGPEGELREAAHAAFDQVLPIGVASAQEAVTLLETIRRDDVPYHEVLRRALRDRAKTAAAPRAPEAGTAAYVRLAEDLVEAATLDQLLRLYVSDAPVADVRKMGARRLASFPYDAARDPDGKLRAARGLLAALPREPDPAVETEILRTLVVLAPAVRGNVREEEMAALLSRLSARGPGASPERRGLVTKLLGELRDPRAELPLEDAFDDLAGGEFDARLAILDALQAIPKDVSTWVARKLEAEEDVRVVRKLAALLARSRSKEAVAAFAKLLAGHRDGSVRLDAAKALGTLWAGSASGEARDALLASGLADRDPAVRRTAAAALGFPGPGDDVIRPRLREVVLSDEDEAVRLAAAKALLDVDEGHAPEHFPALVAAREEVWSVWRDHLLEGLGRRDTTPDRILAAADALVAAQQRPRALELLRGAADAREGARTDAPGRTRVRERLAVVLLDQGAPVEAEQWARKLIEGAERPEDAWRFEVILARALVNSGERPRWADAEARLLALRGNEKLPPALAAETAVVLGDLRMRLDDPSGAIAVLDVPFAAATDPVRLQRDQILERAKARAAEDRKRTFVLLEALDGPGREDAATSLRTLGARAVPALREALARAEEPAQVAPLLRAVGHLTGTTPAVLPETPSREQIADAVKRADAALSAFARSPGVTNPVR